ncbi:hypothetical protein BOW53_16540 [Solemya pervernicosa gill symbiont]|uniref:Phosphatidic acid phosphatase type 2/haloperoxidase domain-containing protein n=2 Tax=Gammaproteobacteria incertae sedis TaxID=118884 RepID=A0A1T2KZ25_9GAMM|nr:bifunctional DedA family/phosphatase PAP2 family protein [Candidatus Reidiella endopervernicosa]OOZ38107.1 hypothetical protein BOW53_16540 [Solemya pervernicosa gill symbiont]QKQ26031.1 VTT domain-containing protein [Candidatus Reidiella endopervernicosa]
MNLTDLQPLLDWLTAHPGWAGLIVFLIACSESLAIVGLIVPGAFLLFAIGTLVGLQILPLWPTLAWTAAGAIIGDGISFWLGRHYHMRLKVIWPFRNHPRLLARGISFFHRHGGKSILIGRFVGPVRPIIPAVAGMLNMPTQRFLTINVLSALAWAPAYILPGTLFGASLELASEVAGRLTLLLLTLLFTLWFVLWLVRRLYRTLEPLTGYYAQRLWDWGHNHPRIGRFSNALIDPNHPEPQALFYLALIILASASGFFMLLSVVIGAPEPSALDQIVFHFFQDHRTPLFNTLMVATTELGDSTVYLPLSITLFAWMLYRRYYSAAAHWMAAILFGIAATNVLKWSLQIPRPIEIYDGLSSFSFPSGHTTMSVVIYGFLAVLIARELTASRRLWAYLAAGLLITPIALSRLYLGAHWLSDVAGGIALGLGWVAIIGLAYRRHPATRLPLRPLLSLTAVMLIISAAINIGLRHSSDLERYAAQEERAVWQQQAWLNDQWQLLPAWRHDLRNRREEPMQIQWRGELDKIEATLLNAGWQHPVELTPRTALLWLSADPSLEQLPLSPKVHAGKYETLALIRPNRQGDGHYVLRLWSTGVEIGDSAQPLWLGALSRQQINHRWLFTFLRTDRTFLPTVEQIQRLLGRNDDPIATENPTPILLFSD